ncbi:MAG: heme-binding protein, partial [Planctomycetaceae bacterium]
MSSMIVAPAGYRAAGRSIGPSHSHLETRSLMFPRIWSAARSCSLAACLLPTLVTNCLLAQTMEQRLQAERPATLVDDARAMGDPVRGAILFHQPWLGCTKCHSAGADGKPLGPELAKAEKDTTAQHLVESVLAPSAKIRTGYQSVALELKSGKTFTGILVENRPEAISFRDLEQAGKTVVVRRDDVEELKLSDQSLMPAGLVNALSSRQQFLDLASYLIEIAEKGPTRALELQPSPSLYAAATLPEYEQKLDHRGLILAWDDASLTRGEAIYNRVCANCHGTPDRAGSLPTSLKFASGKFKNGSEPYAMYQTLTRGFGLMAPQTWMVPRQKYDVIHFIRERYLREQNPSQYARVDDSYLRGLPAGDTLGPEPSNIDPWAAMDYGPTLIATYEAGNDGLNFAYKGIAFRLDDGPGGVSRGNHWMIFDHDTLRVSAAWNRTSPDTGFIDWNSILFNGAHGVHPRLVGALAFGNQTGPGWANPADGSWTDTRLRGRDDRPYGPLPRRWAQYRGLYHHGEHSVVRYTVGTTEILESPGVIDVELPGSIPLPPAKVESRETRPVFTRAFNIGPRRHELVLQVAEHAGGPATLSLEKIGSTRVARFGTGDAGTKAAQGDADTPIVFDGQNYLQLDDQREFSFDHNDLTVVARIKTIRGGTIVCQTQP